MKYCLIAIMTASISNSGLAKINACKIAEAVAEAFGDHSMMVAESPEMRELRADLIQIAPSHVSVAIEGETGTGKEVAARQLHLVSGLEGPFVAINCAAMPENLLESELFGHRKGAFSGANTNKMGLFESAKGGTVFLDEVAEMSPSMQTKLLRVIETEKVRPVGSDEEIDIDVRFVIATNRNLEQMVEDKTFRLDLYYRLAVIPIKIPPLRERSDDIIALIDRILPTIESRWLEPMHISTAARGVLLDYNWPGNVRELQNVLTAAVLFSTGPELTVENFPKILENKDPVESLKEYKFRMETKYLRDVLIIASGVVTRAAQLAKKNRTHFYKLLEKHNIDPKEYHGINELPLPAVTKKSN